MPHVAQSEPPEALRFQCPDAHWTAVAADGSVAARASAWWSAAPSMPGRRPGVIGHFSATDATAALAVLEAACSALHNHGCDLAIGPMDGNTWQAYRFVEPPGDDPPFLLEPSQPPVWPTWWRAAGFDALARYYSTVQPLVASADPRCERIADRMHAAGIAIRPLDPTHFERDLGLIFDVSLASFAGNFLYTPIPRGTFLVQYEKVRSLVRPELVLLAEQAGQGVGYLFALPDLLQPRRGEVLDTAIVKTLAIRPGRAFAGLGALLLDRFRDAALAAGFRRSIHALMHEGNSSRNLGPAGSRTLRTYVLFARPLS